MERTTLQLARAIADAVIDAMISGRSENDSEDAPTQAVIETLYANGAWMCRLQLNDRGITIQTQMELFR